MEILHSRNGSGAVGVEHEWIAMLGEHGPWVGLVFYLLWRDLQKEAALREALRVNTGILTELAVLIRERMPRRGA